jgi:AcrR family transcriptional regulator
MLDAAREVFSQNGYAAARTKAIAEAAGASEQLIFAHFGSKRGLFEEAVLSPLRESLAEYISSFSVAAGREFGPGEELAAFLSGLLRLLLANRRLLAAYVTASRYHVDDFDSTEQQAGLEVGIKRMQDLAERVAREQGVGLADVGMHSRIILATVLGLTVYTDLLFETPVDEGTLAAATSALLLSGIMSQNGEVR